MMVSIQCTELGSKEVLGECTVVNLESIWPLIWFLISPAFFGAAERTLNETISVSLFGIGIPMLCP